MFRLRLDQLDQTHENVLNHTLKICSPSNEVLVVHHVLPHGNPHIHAYLKTDLKEQCLRQRIKRLGYAASQFSLKTCDPDKKDEYIQYLFNKKHDNIPTLLHVDNIDSQHLDRLQTQAQEYHDEYKTNTTTKRTKQLTLYDLAQEVEKIVNPDLTVNDLGPTVHTRMTQGSAEELEAYTDATIKVLKKHKKAFDMFLIRKVIITAMSNNERGIKRIKQNVLNYFINN